MRIRNHRTSFFNCISNNNGGSHYHKAKGKEKKALTMAVIEYCPECWAETANPEPQPYWGDDGESVLDVSSMDHSNTPLPIPMPKVSQVKEPPEKFRVCRVNKSPWDVPSFFRAFDSHWTDTVDSIDKTTPSPLSFSHKRAKDTWKPKQTSDVKYELLDNNETLTLRVVKDAKAAQRKGGLVKLEAEEVLIESALRSVLSQAGDGGLTVREAACKLLVDNNTNGGSGNIPLSVQARRVMLNSPYFVQVKDGRFALWDDFLKSSGTSKETEESCNIKPPPPDHPAYPYSTKTKGKRSARAAGCLKQQQHNAMIGICSQACEQKKYEDSCEWATSECKSEGCVSQNIEGCWRGVKKSRKAVKARSLRSLV